MTRINLDMYLRFLMEELISLTKGLYISQKSPEQTRLFFLIRDINYFVNNNSLYFASGQSSSSTSNSNLSQLYLIFSNIGFTLLQ
jgi:hypothetical protein